MWEDVQRHNKTVKYMARKMKTKRKSKIRKNCYDGQNMQKKTGKGKLPLERDINTGGRCKKEQKNAKTDEDINAHKVMLRHIQSF